MTTPAPEDWGITQTEARELLRAQMCPVCGEGPWKSPISHATRLHKIDAFALRDACGLTVTESVVDEGYAATLAARPQTDTTAATEASHVRGKQRWTTVGREKASARLRAWVEENPEAAAEQLRRAQAAGNAASTAAAHLRRT